MNYRIFSINTIKDGEMKPFTLKMGALTPDEKDIILKGCLINYYNNIGNHTAYNPLL